MSDARSTILERIRKANHGHGNPPTVPDSLEQRLHKTPRGPLPQWTEEHESRFITQLQKAGGTLNKIHQTNEVITEVTAYLNHHDLPHTLVSASSTLLNDLVWPDNMVVERRPVEANDVTVITEAYAAVAETGSIVLCSSQDTPTTFNFLPDNFLCVVQNNRIAAHTEDIWDRVRQEKNKLPRAINFITGPSRTADVEQTIQIGAHGPRRLHVLLLA